MLMGLSSNTDESQGMKMQKKRFAITRRYGCSLVVLAALAFMTTPSSGDTLPYDPLEGDTVRFTDISESSDTDSLPLFGAPTIVGDSLGFGLPLFSSSSANWTSDETSGTLATLIEALPGNYIDQISLDESGDFSIFAFGTAATFASISSRVTLDILEIDGSAPTSPVTVAGDMVFTSDGEWNLADDGMLFGKSWSGSLELDVSAAVADSGYSGHATKVAFEMENVLNTDSEPGTSALIAKKVFGGVSVTTSLVPEPATLTLLAIAAALLLVRRRKR